MCYTQKITASIGTNPKKVGRVVPSSYPGAELPELGKRSDASPGGENHYLPHCCYIFMHLVSMDYKRHHCNPGFVLSLPSPLPIASLGTYNPLTLKLDGEEAVPPDGCQSCS